MVKEIIGITNDKGGVGKTTTAQNLGTALMLKGFKVLVIDTDPQMYLSICNGWKIQYDREGKPSIFSAMVAGNGLPVYKSARGLYFTPSSPRMMGIDPYLREKLSPNTVLREIMGLQVEDQTGEGISTISDFFDYVVIDCPPSMGSITINTMSACTGLVIPIQMESFAVLGLSRVITRFKEVKHSLNPALEIRGLLFVMVDSRLVLTKQYRSGFEENFDENIAFKTIIRKNVDIPESQNSDSDIFNYNPKSNGAKDYMAFTEEFLATSKK